MLKEATAGSLGDRMPRHILSISGAKTLCDGYVILKMFEMSEVDLYEFEMRFVLQMRRMSMQ
jgi:hypothetical protein